MIRVKTVARASLAAAAMLLLVAPAAHAAISNPAAHPKKIVVVIDGVEYTDGQDTLPGYDDYSCGPIPNSWPDYDANRMYFDTDNGVKYISWTEWDRLPGYATWLAKKNAAGSDSGSSSGSGSSGSTSGSTGSTGTKNTGTQAAAENPAATEPAPSPEVTSSVLAAEDPSPSPSPEVTESEDVAVTADDEAIEATPIAASNQSGLGRILLIALFITGVATFAVYEVLRRRPQRERA